MKRFKSSILSGVIAISALAGPISHADSTPPQGLLQEYKSLYRNVTVHQHGQQRCVRLENKKNPYNSQSCIRLDRPKELQFFYTQAMFTALSTQPDGINVLSVGLGGGSIASAMMSYFKDASVTTVEIDPKMVEAAKDYMFFKETERNKVVVRDARYYIRKQMASKAEYDVVLLDAFNGEYIPEHLTTREFLEEVKSVLKPGGMLLSNTFSFKDFYHSESVTYDAVFPDFCSFHSAGTRTIVAYKDKPCNAAELQGEILARVDKLGEYVTNAPFIAKTLRDDKNWNQSARIFTDQFSPANLYNAQ